MAIDAHSTTVSSLQRNVWRASARFGITLQSEAQGYAPMDVVLSNETPFAIVEAEFTANRPALDEAPFQPLIPLPVPPPSLSVAYSRQRVIFEATASQRRLRRFY